MAGVTCLKKIDENQILSGSYDKTLKLWDIRKFGAEVDSSDTEK